MRRSIACAMMMAGALAACGGPDDEGTAMRIAFKAHELQCAPPSDFELKARLEVTGILGICPLDVAADRTVSGVCNGVTAGDIRDFRLVYFFSIGSTDIELATVTARLDLRGETRSKVAVEFPADRVMTDIDDDADGRSNLVEFCQGTNPRVRD